MCIRNREKEYTFISRKKRKIELLKLKKLAYSYLKEQEKPYYQNVANIQNIINIKEPSIEYDEISRQHKRVYHNLIIYENGYQYLVSGSHTVTYIPTTPQYRKK